jgi:RNA 2',3'-cyclic 3'-phosphodiesterase
LRLFVALNVPDEVRRAAQEIVDRLRPAAPKARWVRVEGIHITLKFIGHVKPELLEPIEAVLTEMRLDQPIHINFRGLGFFPNSRRPNVFWAGVEASSNAATLAAKMNDRLAAFDIERETRAFTPHLTLARFKEPQSTSELLSQIDKLATVNLGETVTSEFHLFESKTQRGGSVYTELTSFNFVEGTMSHHVQPENHAPDAGSGGGAN